MAASKRGVARVWLASILVLVTALGGNFASLPRADAATGGLPDHFALGLGAAPDDGGLNGWMPDSHIPWDFAYQYLAGGVNTGHGWATWNDKGQFPVAYAKNADAHGYIPVFSYYTLLQSNGPCGTCAEGDKDRANLNDSGTMQAYYQDFALLMKRLGGGTADGVQGFGKTAIVHVEPDLSGYAQQAAQNSDPSTVPSAVASTGMLELAGIPNTYQGFNWALLHLRDLYAPNVRLAFHISPWSTGVDLGTSRDPNLDVSAIGSQIGKFAAASGVIESAPGGSTYDVVFTDVNDRDAAYYQYAQNDAGRWWDRLNVTYPNFQRWERFVSAAVKASGAKPMFVWQVPLGNQYFQTENNSRAHYQDNRIEYFFAHIDELQQAGIMGLMFGPGAAGVTGYNDAAKDGVTNPSPICTTNGLSSGQICNDHSSTVTDDDGGYLRLAAQQYYAHPRPLGAPVSSGPVPAPTAVTSSQTASGAPLQVDLGGSTLDPQLVAPGQTVTVRQNVIGNGNGLVLVDFELHDADDQLVAQARLPDQHLLLGSVLSAWTVLTVPSDLPAGPYSLNVGILSPDGGAVYAWNAAAGVLTVAGAPIDKAAAAQPSEGSSGG